MSNLRRYLNEAVKFDLTQKMVFIGGPRQVGKTTFSLSFLKNGNIEHPAYLNWDDLGSKKLIKSGELPANEPLIILDEIHKYSLWRNLLKGFYDKRRLRHQFLVTGSARLDHYRKGGDSLLGRYHYYRLHPISINELGLNNIEEVKQLIKMGGFPEPFYRGEEIFAKRWRRERISKIINEDLNDLENVKEISLLENLADRLPMLVGSQLSYQGIANELEVSFKTIQHWLTIFDNLYLTYRLNPYVSGKLRLVKKTQRVFLWDWSGLENPGAQFENFVASQLLKYCHFVEDTQGDKLELRYIKDTDGREIDFLIIKNRKPLFAVECKMGERAVSPAIHYFKQRLSVPMFYQVHLGTKHTIPENGIEVLPIIDFCKKLEMP